MLDRDLIAAQDPGQLPSPASAGGVSRRFKDDELGVIGVGNEKSLQKLCPLGIPMIERLLEHELKGFLEKLLVEAGLLGLDDSGQSLEPDEQFGTRLRRLRVDRRAKKDKEKQDGDGSNSLRHGSPPGAVTHAISARRLMSTAVTIDAAVSDSMGVSGVFI